MLVLSRRAEQQLVFPNLGITVKVLQVRGRLVKIGIDAPKDVKILRPEAGPIGAVGAHQSTEDSSRREVEHELRNKLNTLQLRIQTLQAKIDRGFELDAEAAVSSLLESTATLDHELGPRGTVAVADDEGRAMRLLVVEDSDNERRLMAYLLATEGFDVSVARDGAEALEQLRSGIRKPHVVLMDMQMPMFNGLETLQQIREDESLRDIAVFAVTGSARVPELEPVGHGWDGWFQKPLDVSALVSRLRTEVTSPEAERPVTALPMIR